MKNAYHPERGGAALYIILGIALLAGLSWTISKGFRFSSSSLSNDQAAMAAQGIIDYGNAVAGAVQKLRLRGCADTQLDFGNTTWANIDGSPTVPPGHNVTATSNCVVFGSLVKAAILDQKGFYINNTGGGTREGHARVRVDTAPGIGTAASDLMLFVPWVSDATCMKINDILDVQNNPAAPPNFSDVGFEYTGTYPAGSMTDIDGFITGKTAFCAKNVSTNNRFIQILIAR